MRKQRQPGRTLVLKKETLRRLGGLTAAELRLARGGLVTTFLCDSVDDDTNGRSGSKYCESKGGTGTCL
jgi:hypothetical protein